jgi:hypothetical protein
VTVPRLVLALAIALAGLAHAGEAVCERTAEAKQTTRVCYRCKVDPVCLSSKPTCGACGPCGKPREVRKLIKRFVKEQTVETRCEPRAVCPPAPPKP